jgi:serine/threonine protein kinase
MEVEARRPSMSQIWAQWEGQVVNGTFPLRRCLGSSDHSGVFLTEYAAQNLPHAALKLVPAIPTLAESQLSHWSAAASVAHPHLVRLFETGRCQLGSLHFLYVVMDYAEQNLAQLLLHRPLSEVEVREMLPATLGALAFLHARDLVQGQLKPSNILVIGNELKLASDTIRPAGEATASIGTLSVYNPPEARDGSFSTSGDIWALGVSLCQALTQRPPSRSGERGESVALPTDFPVSFIDIVRRCLARNPAQRPSVADLQDWVKRGPAEPAVVAPQPAAVTKPADIDGSTRLVVRAVLSQEHRPQELAERKSFAPLILGAVAFAVIGWAGVHWFNSHSNSSAPTTETASTAASQPPDSAAGSARNSNETSAETSTESSTATPPAAPTVPAPATPALPGHSSATHPRLADSEAGSSAGVIHEEIPTVSLRSRETIHGHVRVTVRVTVDKSGTVVSDVLDNPGPSKYFARIAGDAAAKWKFTPTDGQAPRQWLLRFEFSRDGTKVYPVPRN